MIKELLLSIVFVSAVIAGFAVHWSAGIGVLLASAYIQWFQSALPRGERRDTQGFIDWCKDEASRLYLENTELQRQLTWRDAVGDPPEEDGFYLIKSIDERLGDCTGASWYRGCQFINIGDKETVTHWLPIPKE